MSDLPVLLPGAAPARLVDTIMQKDTQPGTSITRRQGVIQAINGTPPTSVDVQLGGSGVTIPSVKFLNSYIPIPSDTVWVDLKGTDPLVIGSVSSDRFGGQYRRAANQSVGSGGLQTITFDTQDENIGGFGTVSTAVFTVPTGGRGLYLMFARAIAGAALAGRSFVEITTSQTNNGDARESISAAENVGSVTGWFDLADAATFGVNVFHTTGVAVNFTVEFRFHRLLS